MGGERRTALGRDECWRDHLRRFVDISHSSVTIPRLCVHRLEIRVSSHYTLAAPRQPGCGLPVATGFRRKRFQSRIFLQRFRVDGETAQRSGRNVGGSGGGKEGIMASDDVIDFWV